MRVKSTTSRYLGEGIARKLNVRVAKKDVAKLRNQPAPTFVVGIDIDKPLGFILAITETTAGGISGIPTRHALNCRSLRRLWREVDDYWKARRILALRSSFS